AVQCSGGESFDFPLHITRMIISIQVSPSFFSVAYKKYTIFTIAAQALAWYSLKYEKDPAYFFVNCAYPCSLRLRQREAGIHF
ncbi:MAG: hypothetical protein IJL40_02370, partial [Oscillospiraceae bacterium]|nr:hypothetical protein [Oscillospiraceae bacterium]